MSLLNSLKGAIFVNDEKPGQAATAIKTNGAPSPIQQGSQVVGEQNTLVNGVLFKTMMTETLSRNTAFTSLMTTADKLVNVIADPVQRLKAAQSVSGDGRSAQQVADAVNIHLSDLDNI